MTDITMYAEKGTSLWEDAWRRLRKNRLALAGLLVLGAFVTIAILTPWIAPYAYDAQNLNLGATPPSAAHWLGTDVFGRDLLTQIMYGGRISLAVGFVATAVALLIGISWGAIAGYLGGRVDAVMMCIVDILYALPFMIFIVLLMVVFGRNLLLLFLAIGAVEWLTMARIMRGQVLALKHEMFVEAAVALGRPHHRIIARHIIPNVIGPVIIYATLTIPQMILFESFLSFLGLGVQEPQASLGSLINEGAQEMESAVWMLLVPAGFLVTLLTCFNFLGDGLRDALDPRER